MNITDSLREKLIEALTGMVNENTPGIVEEITAADDGKLTVGMSVKLTLHNGRVHGDGSLGYSRKFKAECEFVTEDPAQMELAEGGTL